MENNTKQPLLTPSEPKSTSLTSSSSHAHHDEDDINPITTLQDFLREFSLESKKLWFLAGPAMFTAICQYSIGATTQVLAGHLGTIQLAAVSVENAVIAGLAFGIMLGMGSALETLCGQAYGAGQLDMLGIYMQRSCVILNTTALAILFIYVFATQLLNLIGQPPNISAAAGTFALWVIPQLFAYANNFPIQKFLQAQSKIMVMAVIAASVIVVQVFFSWLFMMRLRWGLVAGAVMLDLSWWLIVVAQMIYILIGSCGEAWSGFSWRAFHNLKGFIKLSLASAVMLCLEFWYLMVLVLFAGYLKNAEIAVDALSICMNIMGLAFMVALGFNTAISVRVSNELGAGHPRMAKFSVVVVILWSLVIGSVLALVLLLTRNEFPSFFSNDNEVKHLVKEMAPLLAISIVLNNVQPALSGVAVGAGWQAQVAFINIICYYLIGIPLGLITGFLFDMGVKGIWIGMLAGTGLQTFVLIWMIHKTNWTKEASIAGERIKQWGGGVTDGKANDDVLR